MVRQQVQYFQLQKCLTIYKEYVSNTTMDVVDSFEEHIVYTEPLRSLSNFQEQNHC